MDKKLNKAHPPKITTPTATASNRAKIKNLFSKLGRGCSTFQSGSPSYGPFPP